MRSSIKICLVRPVGLGGLAGLLTDCWQVKSELRGFIITHSHALLFCVEVSEALPWFSGHRVCFGLVVLRDMCQRRRNAPERIFSLSLILLLQLGNVFCRLLRILGSVKAILQFLSSEWRYALCLRQIWSWNHGACVIEGALDHGGKLAAVHGLLIAKLVDH